MAQPGSRSDAKSGNFARLKPILPKWNHICFYPMNKRREGNDNWYMLSMDERKTMMRSHGMIGRNMRAK